MRSSDLKASSEPPLGGERPAVELRRPMLLVAVDRDHRGMEHIVERVGGAAFAPSARELAPRLAAARDLRRASGGDVAIVVVLPANQPRLVAVALSGGADRVVTVHQAEAPRRRWTEVALRASGAVIDWVIAPDELSFRSAIRLGADPDRIDVVDLERGDLGRLFATIVREPARRHRSGGAGEAAASLLLDALELSGALTLAERLRRGVNVVNYHRVLPVDELRRYGRPQMAIAEPVFEAQIETMAERGFTPVEAVRAASSAGKVAITFDDGYEDNFRVALPILQRYSVPACVFLVTALIGEPEALWWDRVGLSLFAYWRAGAGAPIPDELPRAARALEAVSSFHEARDVIAAALSELNAADQETRDAAVRAAESLVSRLRPPRTMLSWNEVNAMHAEGLTFGAHTRSHVCLDEVPPEVARDELLGSLEDVAAHVGAAQRLAALPRGRLGPLHEDELKTMGIDSVMSTTAGVNATDDPSLLVKRRDGIYLTLRGRHHPAKLRLELSGLLDRIRPRIHE